MIDPPLSAEVMRVIAIVKAIIRARCLATMLDPSNVVHVVLEGYIYVLGNPLISDLLGVDDEGELVWGQRPNLHWTPAPGGARLRVLRPDLLFRLDLDGSNIVDGGNLWPQC